MEFFVKFIILFVVVLMISIKSSESRTLGKNIAFNSDEETERCRSKCIYKFLIEKPTASDCPNDPNCFMCWDYCRFIAKASTELANSMCGDEFFCFDGCQMACSYHKIKSVRKLLKTMKNSV